jgi:hypothetical protein
MIIHNQVYFTIRIIVSFLLLPAAAISQSIEVLHQGNGVSIRGMSVVDDNNIWVSGSKGTVGRSGDGGKTWEWHQVPGFEKREFRDIEAFDEFTAVILAIAEPGEILKTKDAGKTWSTVYSDSTKGIFLDAFHFSAAGQGTVIGDPINGTIYLATTSDRGDYWTRVQDAPVADSGEACFASSGTNIVSLDNGGYLFATGGLSSRLHGPGKSVLKLPLLQGQQSTGANSIAVFGNKAVVVGGDFAKDTFGTDNCVLVHLGKKPQLSRPVSGPHGYRSCVEFIDAKKVITCGTSGVDLSVDAGNNWKLVTTQGFHVCQKAKKGNSVYLAGSNGRIAKFSF